MYKVERNCNNTFHGGINDVPLEIWNGKKVESKPIRPVENLEVGDSVRVLLKKNELQKRIYKNGGQKFIKSFH